MLPRNRVFLSSLLIGLPVLSLMLMSARRAESRPEVLNVEAGMATATFAGGCFWCVEEAFDQQDGVVSTVSGYIGGRTRSPSYDQVSVGGTGHAEAVQVVYDPSKIGYERLLAVFWHNIDPLTAAAQFCDHGNQYRSAIFYHDDAQRRLAEESKTKLERSGRFKQPIVTEIVAASEFYPAEEYHQDYYRKNPVRYKVYKWNCGRAQRLKQLWGTDAGHASNAQAKITGGRRVSYEKKSDAELKRSLTPMQYKVTQHEGTELPFRNEYWDNHQAGIYVDIVSGEPLFSSLDKFESGTGWPSFTKPLDESNVVRKEDRKLFFKRVEVRSAHADSHLGHVFDDGPEPTGQRYCMNSAAMRFIPVDRLKAEGYEQYLPLFQKQEANATAHKE